MDDLTIPKSKHKQTNKTVPDTCKAAINKRNRLSGMLWAKKYSGSATPNTSVGIACIGVACPANIATLDQPTLD